MVNLKVPTEKILDTVTIHILNNIYITIYIFFYATF